MVKPATLARSALSLGPSLLLPLLLPLSPRCAHAYEPGTGSFATGNLNLTAPYGIRPSEFRAVTARLTSSATFNITGYDVSADPGASANANANAEIAGWTLTVGVTTDVSLIDAANSSNLDFEATTLYMAPPGGSGGNMTLLPAWRVCAVVYLGLAAGGQEAANSSSSASVEVDGTCDGVLSGGCIQAIQSGTAGIDSNGTCDEYVLPSACADEFPEASVNSTAFAITQSILDDGRFYAYGSPATQTGDEVAYEVAFENIWPVITLFGHGYGANGTSQGASLNTAVQCVRALNGTTTSPTGPASKSGSPSFRHAVPTLLSRYGFFVISFFVGQIFLV